MLHHYTFIILVLYQIYFDNTALSYVDDCKWKKSDHKIEVYYINMDKSRQRKKTIEKHLSQVNLKHHRIRGIPARDIYVPVDVQKSFLNECIMGTSWRPPPVANTNSSTENFAVTALCGRKKNNRKEIGCTTSHLYAMREAIYSTTAKSRYALILEDDVFIPFDIDFDELVSTAPTDFGILQLFNSNPPTMKQTFDDYTGNPKQLWMPRNLKLFQYWSTCAYLIDRVVMKPIIDKVLIVDSSGTPSWFMFKLIAGFVSPCTPAQCCDSSSQNVFSQGLPCVFAPRGYQADSFLYAMTKTYTISVPLITNGIGGNQSTFHQFHVETNHRRAFLQQRGYINRLLSGAVPLPSFAKPACPMIDENQM